MHSLWLTKLFTGRTCPVQTAMATLNTLKLSNNYIQYRIKQTVTRKPQILFWTAQTIIIWFGCAL